MTGSFDDIADDATRIANSFELMADGQQTAAVMLATAMFMAHCIALGGKRDVDGYFRLMRRAVDEELKRQFPVRS